jgi:hypothetical protein
MWKQASGAIPIGGGGLGGHVLPQWYICTGCGYAEQYIAREADREKLRKKWKLATERDD